METVFAKDINVLNIKEKEDILKNLFLIVDTREQPTEKYYERLEAVGLPFRRQKLDYGDYSVGAEANGKIYDFSNIVAIERKMSLDEIASNLTRGRDRFGREFERALNDNCKMHLIIENGSYQKVIEHKYRSKLNENAFLSSLIAFCVRYNVNYHFCRPIDTPKLIFKILKFSVKEFLENV